MRFRFLINHCPACLTPYALGGVISPRRPTPPISPQERPRTIVDRFRHIGRPPGEPPTCRSPMASGARHLRVQDGYRRFNEKLNNHAITAALPRSRGAEPMPRVCPWHRRLGHLPSGCQAGPGTTSAIAKQKSPGRCRGFNGWRYQTKISISRRGASRPC